MQQDLFGQTLHPAPQRVHAEPHKHMALHPWAQGGFFFGATEAWTDEGQLVAGCLLDGTPQNVLDTTIAPAHIGAGGRHRSGTPATRELLDVLERDPVVTTQAWPDPVLREAFLEFHDGLQRNFDMLSREGARWRQWHGTARFSGADFECHITHLASGKAIAFTLDPRSEPRLRNLLDDARRSLTPRAYWKSVLRTTRSYQQRFKKRHQDLVQRIQALGVGAVPDFMVSHECTSIFSDFQDYAFDRHLHHSRWLWREQAKLAVPDALVEEHARNELDGCIEGSLQAVPEALDIIAGVLHWAADPQPPLHHDLRTVESAQSDLVNLQAGLHSMQAAGLKDARIQASLDAVAALMALPTASLAARQAVEVARMLTYLQNIPEAPVDIAPDDEDEEEVEDADDGEE